MILEIWLSTRFFFSIFNENCLNYRVTNNVNGNENEIPYISASSNGTTTNSKQFNIEFHFFTFLLFAMINQGPQHQKRIVLKRIGMRVGNIELQDVSIYLFYLFNGLMNFMAKYDLFCHFDTFWHKSIVLHNDTSLVLGALFLFSYIEIYFI